MENLELKNNNDQNKKLSRWAQQQNKQERIRELKKMKGRREGGKEERERGREEGGKEIIQPQQQRKMDRLEL